MEFEFADEVYAILAKLPELGDALIRHSSLAKYNLLIGPFSVFSHRKLSRGNVNATPYASSTSFDFTIPPLSTSCAIAFAKN